MLLLRLKGRWIPYVQNTARAQSDLFTVQCCHWDSKADGPSSQHCESTELSLHCSMLLFRLKGRWTPYVQNTARAQSDLFTVQCCHWDSKADGPSSQHCLSTELSLHCSMLSLRLKGRWTPLQHCQSTEWSLHCSMLSFRLKPRWTPLQHCQSTEWSLHCSMLSLRLKPRWTSSSQHCQSTEWSLHCSMLSFRLKGRWTPKSTLSKHRVIASLFNVAIETQRQMDPYLVNTVRAQNDLFTVQCCQWDSKADGPPSQHGQSTVWFLHCSMLSLRLKGRWTPQSTQSEHRFTSSLFNVVNETQRQIDPPVNTDRAQI